MSKLPNGMNTLAHLGTFGSLLVVAVAGGVWVGGIEVQAENALRTAGRVEQIRTDQAVIKEQIRQIRIDGEKRDEKLDKLLEEIRRRNTRSR